ncbi:MAG TPA: amidohydrolase/deacetylase family metallohydrolase [Cyclobacteriaceae bacterium]|nr:amidohydrolase/deacetylase family metallohydrolase [Cyclobacteriaceae bacterium]
MNALARYFLTVCLCVSAALANGQPVDLLIRNGHVIDPKNNIDAVMDVAIVGGKISEVATRINKEAKNVIDATNLYVIPGIIDIHGHHFFGTQPNAYLSNSFTALPPDGFTLRAGVTAVADAGGSGWRDFETFKSQTIERSKTKVFAFINIVGSGMRGGAHEQNLGDMDPKLTAMIAKQYPQYIVGVKLAHYMQGDWEPTERAVKAGALAGIPVMVDFGGADPPLSLQTLLLEKLRPGDIFTHCYAHTKTRLTLVENGKVQPFAFEAQKRGVIMDVGHGGGSFTFEQALPAIQQGLKPNSISTDLHTGSMNTGMKDMLNVMSKLINCGLTLNEVVTASTWKPAQIINKKELGNLTVGAPADVAILSLDQGRFGFIDTNGLKINGDKKLTCQATILNGDVVWDLNGIAAKPYK